jgi:hypothetical protein
MRSELFEKILLADVSEWVFICDFCVEKSICFVWESGTEHICINSFDMREEIDKSSFMSVLSGSIDDIKIFLEPPSLRDNVVLCWVDFSDSDSRVATIVVVDKRDMGALNES